MLRTIWLNKLLIFNCITLRMHYLVKKVWIWMEKEDYQLYNNSCLSIANKDWMISAISKFKFFIFPNQYACEQ